MFFGLERSTGQHHLSIWLIVRSKVNRYPRHGMSKVKGLWLLQRWHPEGQRSAPPPVNQKSHKSFWHMGAYITTTDTHSAASTSSSSSSSDHTDNTHTQPLISHRQTHTRLYTKTKVLNWLNRVKKEERTSTYCLCKDVSFLMKLMGVWDIMRADDDALWIAEL